MEGVKFITDETGKKVAIQIDLTFTKKSGKDYVEFLENIEDIIDIEQSRNEVAEPWEDFKKQKSNY